MPGTRPPPGPRRLSLRLPQRELRTGTLDRNSRGFPGVEPEAQPARQTALMTVFPGPSVPNGAVLTEVQANGNLGHCLRSGIDPADGVSWHHHSPRPPVSTPTPRLPPSRVGAGPPAGSHTSGEVRAVETPGGESRIETASWSRRSRPVARPELSLRPMTEVPTTEVKEFPAVFPYRTGLQPSPTGWAIRCPHRRRQLNPTARFRRPPPFGGACGAAR